MARDDLAPGVEFSTAHDDDAAEEELSAGAPRSFWSNRRWTLALGAAVLIAAALLTRGLSNSNTPQAQPSPSVSSFAAIGPPGPAPSELTGQSYGLPAPGPVGNRTAQNFCPTQSGCSIVRTLPREAVQAINSAFADAIVRTTTSIIGPSANRIAPELIDRRVTVDADGVTVAIHIGLSGAKDRDAYGQVRAATSKTTLRSLTSGYTIDITATRRGAPVPTATLDKLAADVGLLTPE